MVRAVRVLIRKRYVRLGFRLEEVGPQRRTGCPFFFQNILAHPCAAVCRPGLRCSVQENYFTSARVLTVIFFRFERRANE